MRLKPRSRQTETCPLCRDQLAFAERMLCPGCRTPYHAECHAELGGCATLGCGRPAGRRAPAPVERPEPPARSHQADHWFSSEALTLWVVLEVVFGILSILAMFT